MCWMKGIILLLRIKSACWTCKVESEKEQTIIGGLGVSTNLIDSNKWRTEIPGYIPKVGRLDARSG